MRTGERLNQNKQDIIDKYNSGYSTTKIAKLYCCGNSIVYYFLKENGANINKRNSYVGQHKEDLYAKIKDMYGQNISICKMTKILGVSDDFIYTAFIKLGFNSSRFSKQRAEKLDEKEIIELYQSGLSGQKVANLKKCSERAIRRILEKYHINRRPLNKYEFDRTYFDKIDTPAKAWIFGCFLADGNNKRHGITISMTDKDVIEKIKNHFKYDGPISQRIPDGNRKIQYILGINNKKLAEQFAELGCPPNKTFITKFPEESITSRNLLRHFILGYLDGDGGIYKTNTSMTGTLELMEGIKNFIIKELNFPEHVIKTYCRHPKRLNNTRSIQINRQKYVKLFLDWLYKDTDSSIRMDRKYSAYEQFWKNRPSKH